MTVRFTRESLSSKEFELLILRLYQRLRSARSASANRAPSPRRSERGAAWRSRRSAVLTSSSRSLRHLRVAMIRSTAFTPRPGTRNSISRGARFTSTGSSGEFHQRPGELGIDGRAATSPSPRPPPPRPRSLIVIEAHQPVGLDKADARASRAGVAVAARRGVRDRAERRIIDAAQAEAVVQGRRPPDDIAVGRRIPPTIIWVDWPAGAKPGADLYSWPRRFVSSIAVFTSAIAPSIRPASFSGKRRSRRPWAARH